MCVVEVAEEAASAHPSSDDPVSFVSGRILYQFDPASQVSAGVRGHTQVTVVQSDGPPLYKYTHFSCIGNKSREGMTWLKQSRVEYSRIE